MRALLRLLAVLMIGAGLFLAIFPLWSVSSLTGQVLEEAPAIEGVETNEDRHVVSALWTSDFELAQRMYPAGVTAEDAIDALGDEFQSGGFTSGSFAGPGVHSKTCCGNYDAVIVKTVTEPDGRVTQSFTVFDSDVQFAYALFATIGLILASVGAFAYKASAQTYVAGLDSEPLLVDA